MAMSKEDIKHATARVQQNEDEATRVGFLNGTPLEGGKIADSEPVDLFSSAHNIDKAQAQSQAQAQGQPDRAGPVHLENEDERGDADGDYANSTSRRLPKKSPMPGVANYT